MLNYQNESIAAVLESEFTKRKKRNSAYSLRAFARDLKISPSTLSDVLNGKQGLSQSSLDVIVPQLASKSRDQQFIKDLVLAGFARNKKVRAMALKRVQEVRRSESFVQLRETQFRVISDWYHGALLELMQLRDFQSETVWMARQLGLSSRVVDAALKRLEELDMIYRDDKQEWRARPDAYKGISEVPSSAFRKFHRQLLAMHAESLHEDAVQDREFCSTILAIPAHQLDELKEELRQFFSLFSQKIKDEPKDCLYSVGLQFCPVRSRRPQEH